MTNFGSVHYGLPYWLSTHEPVVNYYYATRLQGLCWCSYIVLPQNSHQE
jgi:hypothetical protein